MGKRIWAAVLLCALCLFSFSACKSSKSFVYPLDKIPKNLDPQVAATKEEQTVISALYEGLVALDENGKPQPAAAKSWQVSGDGLVYTFTLRDSLRWQLQQKSKSQSNPSPEVPPLTAEDFAYGLRRTLLPETKSPHAPLFGVIAGAEQLLQGAGPGALGVRALDDHTLEIRLTQPDSGFLPALATAGAMPCDEEFFRWTKGSYGLNAVFMLCNGPYKLLNWDEKTGIALRAQNAGATGVAALRFPLAKPEDDVAARFARGDSDAAVLPALTEGEKGPEGQTFYTTTWCLLANPASEKGMQQLPLRQALAASALLSLDGHKIPAGFAAATGLVPPTLSFGEGSYREAAGEAGISSDLALAKDRFHQALLALQKSRLSGVRVLLPEQPALTAAADAVSQGWQKDFSAYFALEKLPPADFDKALRAGQYDLALIPVKAPVRQLYPLLDFYGKTAFPSGSPSSFSSALAALAQNRSGGDIGPARRAEQALLEEATLIPLLWQQNRFVTTSWVKGIYFEPCGEVLYLGKTHT